MIILPTWLLGLTFVLFWNSGFIGADFCLPNVDPFTLLFWRYWLLVIILGGYLIVRGQLKWPGWSAAGMSALIGILAHAVWLLCVFYALLYEVSPGMVALVVALQPMVTGALSGRAVGEHTPFFRWVGLIIGFVGVLIAVTARMDMTDPQSLMAYCLPFGSVLAITVASLIQRNGEVGQRVKNLPITLDLFYQSLGTGLFVTLPAIWIEQLETRWTGEFVATMLWLVLGVSLVAYGLMWMLLKRLDATRVASLFYLGPPVTMLMAWAAFGDTLISTDIIGLAVIGLGVLMTQRTQQVVQS